MVRASLPVRIYLTRNKICCNLYDTTVSRYRDRFNPRLHKFKLSIPITIWPTKYIHMTSNIYALLVGIDNYASPVNPLEGCVNDVLAIEEYLQSRVKAEGWKLHLRTLKDEQATRQGIIDGFRKHLCQAGSGDVVLFHYSGHGSQENAPEEFWDIEPDKLNETLVCYDSRQQGKRDLADKELAKLISEVAEKNPQIVLILDCCHSGSGSRDPFQETAVRESDKDERSHTLEEYIFSKEEIDNLIAGKKASGWSLPKGKNILFASCQNSEKAKEFVADGQKRGAFSYFLTETLKKAKGNLTYRDLFKQTNASVRSKYNNQSPQLEAIDSKDLSQLFLGGAIGDRHPYYTVYDHKEYGWVIDGGAVHGVPRRDNDETMHLAIFPIETQGKDLRKLSNKVAEARITEVLPQLSKIEITPNFDDQKEQTFKAVITSLPLPRKTVSFAGDTEGVKLLQQAIQTIEDGNQPSLYVREVGKEQETAEFKVLARNGEYIITRPADGVPIVASIQEYTKENAVKIIQRLEHITRWTNISELSSPANSQINSDDIKVEIHHNSEILSDAEVRFNYYQDNSGKWKEPQFKVKLKNTSSKTLYCALLDLTEQFSIDASFFEAGFIKLNSGEETWVLGGDMIDASVPQELWERGITDYQDIFKLIVCTSEFDARLLEQDKLDLPRKQTTPNHRGDMRSGTLNRLMNRVQSRDLKRSKAEESDDWVTSQVVIKTHRPLETTTVPNTGNGVSLGAGVLLKAHSQLQAEARLTNVSSSTRS